MKFRPCIDIHNGKVKQIIGSSLTDAGDGLRENYVAQESAAHFAAKFAKDGLTGGHIVLLNKSGTEAYEASKKEALDALSLAPGMFSIGGGITPENAADFLEAGAYAVLVTSYLFEDGAFSAVRLAAMETAVGADRIILDLSCQNFAGVYHVMADRWQTKTSAVLSSDRMEELSNHCLEFLVHGTAVEGKQRGMDEELVRLLGSYASAWSARPVTYAGGIRSTEDLAAVRRLGLSAVDVTVGSALDMYGGTLPYTAVLAACADGGGVV